MCMNSLNSIYRNNVALSINIKNNEGSRNKSIHLYGQLICDKGGKKYNGEKTISFISGASKVGQLHVRQ